MTNMDNTDKIHSAADMFADAIQKELGEEVDVYIAYVYSFNGNIHSGYAGNVGSIGALGATMFLSAQAKKYLSQD